MIPQLLSEILEALVAENSVVPVPLRHPGGLVSDHQRQLAWDRLVGLVNVAAGLLRAVDISKGSEKGKEAERAHSEPQVQTPW